MSPFDQLTEKQQVFVVEYATDMNRVRAAKEAGYTGHLSQQADRLLRNPKVKAALAEVGTKLDASMLTVENLAQQLARFIWLDVTQFVDDENYLKCSLKKLPEDVRQCIQGFEVEKDYDRETGELSGEKIKITWVPKIKAVELAMKWRQMLQPTTISFNQQNNDNRTMNWDDFNQEPVKVVEQKIAAALNDGQKLLEGEVE